MEEKIFYKNNEYFLCGILNNISDDKIIVMCHGIRGNKEECGSFSYFSKVLKENGYSSFRFDFNGHGESGGKDYEMTITKEINDLECTINMLIKRGYKEFVLVGGSFGASIVSLFPYEKYLCVKGIILWYGALNYDYIKYGNLFTSENKKIAEKNGYYISNSLNSKTEFKFGLNLFNEIDSYKPYLKLTNNKLPKLFVHGSEDSAVPYKLSKIVSDNCENSKFILIKNGEHTFQNSKEALEEAIITSLNFVKQII